MRLASVFILSATLTTACQRAAHAPSDVQPNATAASTENAKTDTLPTGSPLSPADSGAPSRATREPPSCAGDDIDLRDVFENGACETTDSPEDVALQSSNPNAIETRIDSLPGSKVRSMSPGGSAELTIRFVNTGSRALAIYFRFDPHCGRGDRYTAFGSPDWGIRTILQDDKSHSIPSSPPACALNPGPLRTVRVIVPAGKSAHIAHRLNLNRLDERGALHDLSPGRYSVSFVTPLVGVAEVPGRETKVVSMPFVIVRP